MKGSMAPDTYVAEDGLAGQQWEGGPLSWGGWMPQSTRMLEWWGGRGPLVYRQTGGGKGQMWDGELVEG